jgi:S-adenosylmethionine:tRNA ribosyltransferase-isomerase
MKIADYTYLLPKELIAAEPADPRDSSRILVYSTATDEIAFDIFANIARYLPQKSVMVLNDTKVVPARLQLAKLTGGAVRILFLVNEWDGAGPIKGLPDKKLRVGESLYLNHRPAFEVISQRNEEFTFKLLIPAADLERLLGEQGTTPLPPYIKSSLTEESARRKYQTVFANTPASVAAPTASLHFTEQVFHSLAERGIERALVTLHVGRGTFSPVSPDMIAAGALHSEPIEISAESAQLIATAKKEGRAVIAVGTTATRLLETAAPQILGGEAFKGETSLLIAPLYQFKIVDALITNFHLPETSLLMLVDALLRHKGAKRSWKELYEIAIVEKFRFYSFGDAMVVI